MAVRSGMDYTGMHQLIKYLEGRAGQINTLLRDSIPSLVPKIEEAYSGEAAAKYRDVLSKTAEDMNATLSELIKKLNTTTEEMEAAYKAQEAKMAESVSSVQVSNSGE